MNRTTEQSNRFHALLNELGIMRIKEDLVLEFSGGKETSSRMLGYYETERLLNHLQQIKDRQNTGGKFAPSEKVMKMRRKIFSVFHELRWELPGGKLDYPRINAWLTKSGYLHKPLNDYTEQELPKLVTQVETMLKKSYSHA